MLKFSLPSATINKMTMNLSSHRWSSLVLKYVASLSLVICRLSRTFVESVKTQDNYETCLGRLSNNYPIIGYRITYRYYRLIYVHQKFSERIFDHAYSHAAKNSEAHCIHWKLKSKLIKSQVGLLTWALVILMQTLGRWGIFKSPLKIYPKLKWIL